MVAPLQASGKEIPEQAVVKKLKEGHEKPKEQFVSTLEIDHKPTENPGTQTENKDQHSTTAQLKPILKDKSKEIDKSSVIESPEVEIQKPPSQHHKSVSSSAIKKENAPLKESDTKPTIKTVKIKSPEPDKPISVSSPEPKIELSDVRSSLKKVPHVAVARRKSFTEKDDQPQEASQVSMDKRPTIKSEIVIPVNSENDQTTIIQSTPPIATQTHLKTQTQNIDNTVAQHKDTDSPKERIIPIQFVNENRGPKPFKLESSSRPQTPVNSLPHPDKIESPKSESKKEHHIPIVIEGKSRRSDHPSEDPEHSEKLDNFNASSISRRRWGSRKKRMSSAFSDSSMSDDDALTTPFGGLQKYSSYGKHGPGEEPLFTLRKTRPPFAVTRTESFSSGEEDFDDDGFQEMTAENLFSTLLSRVKSLTRRIHDEHDEHLNWQQKQRHGPPKLNPGGTHARLERTAQRNSIKRDREPHQPAAYSRQSSTYSREDENVPNRSYNDSPSLKQFGNSSYTPTRIYNRSNSTNDNDSRFSTGSRYSTGTGKRYDESDGASDYSSNISITSSQRLRPGYLPPPSNINTDNASNSNRSSANSNDIDAHSIAQSIISRAQDKQERSIPISIQRQNSSDSPTNSKPGTPLPTPGVYMKHMKPFTPTHTNDNSQNNSRLESPEPISDGGNGDRRRVSRFLRPDFYDIPKEDSIYAKMRELEDDDVKNPRYLRVGHGRTSKSGRSTPLDYSSYNKEDRSKSDSLTPQQDTLEGAAPASEGSRNYIRSLKNYEKKISTELNDIEHDILLAGVNKLRREGKIHSTEVSEISDGLRTPEDSESVTSEIFGAPDFVKEGEESFADRVSRSSYLSRLDENNSLTRNGRKSVTKEPFEDRPTRYTSARPVARRSVSRELFDIKYNTGKISPSPYSTINEPDPSSALSPISRRVSRFSREGSSSRDKEVSELDHGISSGYNSSLRGSDGSGSMSLSRGVGSGSDSLSRHLPSRPTLSSAGRSTTQSDSMRNSALPLSRYSEDESSLSRPLGGSLKDRKREDWRRISVPERGKDFNSLPRKYNRQNKNSYI